MKSAGAMTKGMERMDGTGMEKAGEKGKVWGCGRPIRVRRRKDEQGGFVHALWLLVVLSAFLFGATLVNVAIGMKLYEASSKQTRAIEKLTLSVREVQESILYLSEIIEEAEEPAEEGFEAPIGEGRI